MEIISQWLEDFPGLDTGYLWCGFLHFASPGNYGKLPELFRDFVEQEECTGCRTMGNLISSTPQPLAIGKNGDKPWARMSAQRANRGIIL